MVNGFTRSLNAKPENKQPMPKKITTGRALAQERAMIIRHIQRIRRTAGIETASVLCDVIAWIRQRDERYNKKPRGLGK